MIKKARTALLLIQPFFGALAMRLSLIEDPYLDTMATDGRSIYYNPTFVKAITYPELIGVVAHEIMHPALCHHTRRGQRDPGIWNEAADYVINPIILNAGLKLPKDVLFNKEFATLSAEQVYSRLLQKKATAAAAALSGRNIISRGGFGQVIDAPVAGGLGAPISANERRRIEQEWGDAVARARWTAKMAGHIPAGLERLLQIAAEAQVDWKDCLRMTYVSTIPIDYSWTEPDKRFIGDGLYLPSVRRKGAGELAIGIDCSSSIRKIELAHFAAETNALIQEHQPIRVHVLYFDTKVHRHDTYECGEVVEFTPVGGGGTSFCDFFERIEAEGINAHTAILFTDLEGEFPIRAPLYPTIWVATTAHLAPFGETIPICVD